MIASTALTVLGNVADFVPVHVTHDSDFVQVHVQGVTYARAIRQRCGLQGAIDYARHLAAQVQEVAGLVSAPALVAWLLDCGFVVVH